MEMIAGIDIGYSAVKVAFGQREASTPAQVVTLPAGAGPRDQLAPQVYRSAESGIEVLMDGEPWVAGINPERFPTQPREVHEDYARTRAFTALLKAALALPATEDLGAVVTGLPVQHFQRQGMPESLKDTVQGPHDLGDGRTVTVHEAQVAPQPLGSYVTVATEGSGDPTLADIIKHGRVVIVDPGHYSVDWTVLDQGALQAQHSGSSLHAGYQILGEAASHLGEHQKAQISPERIEQALREGQSRILVHGQAVDMTEALGVAGERVGQLAATELRRCLRTASDADPDLVIPTGGGAHLIAPAIRAIFPRARYEIPEDPVSANARGYWYYLGLQG